MALARLRPDSQLNDPLGQRVIDEAYNWHQLSDIDQSEITIQDFLKTYRTAPSVAAAREASIPYSLMSQGKKDVLDICNNQIIYHEYNIKRILVQGKAGTGKSAVIKLMCQLLDEAQPLNR